MRQTIFLPVVSPKVPYEPNSDSHLCEVTDGNSMLSGVFFSSTSVARSKFSSQNWLTPPSDLNWNEHQEQSHSGCIAPYSAWLENYGNKGEGFRSNLA